MVSRPPASSPQALQRMKTAKRRDTSIELRLRRAMHSLGLRYRVDSLILPGLRRRADVLFVTAKVAVFVDGCFWHCCPMHRSFPKANAQWWAAKLGANQQRDEDTNIQLRKAGWTVARVWEHESPTRAAARIFKMVQLR